MLASTITEPLLRHLQADGYQAQIDSDGDIVFRFEGMGYVLCFDADDAQFGKLLLPNVWTIDTPEELLRDVLSQKPKVMDFSEKTGTADDPVDFADASALATAAQNYQAEQAKQGRTISMTDAVNHVKKGAQQ